MLIYKPIDEFKAQQIKKRQERQKVARADSS